MVAEQSVVKTLALGIVSEDLLAFVMVLETIEFGGLGPVTGEGFATDFGRVIKDHSEALLCYVAPLEATNLL